MELCKWFDQKHNRSHKYVKFISRTYIMFTSAMNRRHINGSLILVNASVKSNFVIRWMEYMQIKTPFNVETWKVD